jgi:hypothetical protein
MRSEQAIRMSDFETTPTLITASGHGASPGQVPEADHRNEAASKRLAERQDTATDQKLPPNGIGDGMKATSRIGRSPTSIGDMNLLADWKPLAQSHRLIFYDHGLELRQDIDDAAGPNPAGDRSGAW